MWIENANYKNGLMNKQFSIDIWDYIAVQILTKSCKKRTLKMPMKYGNRKTCLNFCIY